MRENSSASRQPLERGNSHWPNVFVGVLGYLMSNVTAMHFQQILGIFVGVNLVILLPDIEKYNPIVAGIAFALVAIILIASIMVFSAACCHLDPCSKVILVLFGVILVVLLLTVATSAGLAIWAMEIISLPEAKTEANIYSRDLIEQRNDLVASTYQKCCIDNKPSSVNANLLSATSSSIINNTRLSLTPGSAVQLITDTIVNGLSTYLIQHSPSIIAVILFQIYKSSNLTHSHCDCLQ